MEIVMQERILGKFTLALLLSVVLTGCASFDNNAIPERHTAKELRDQNIVKQEVDYSCGAAALATLMIYYFGDQTSEKEILTLLESMFTKDEWLVKQIRGF